MQDGNVQDRQIKAQSAADFRETSAHPSSSCRRAEDRPGVDDCAVFIDGDVAELKEDGF